MERAVTVRPALPEDGQVLFAMNLAFNGEGVASPQEAALALAHPGPERVLLAFVACLLYTSNMALLVTDFCARLREAAGR